MGLSQTERTPNFVARVPPKKDTPKSKILVAQREKNERPLECSRDCPEVWQDLSSARACPGLPDRLWIRSSVVTPPSCRDSKKLWMDETTETRATRLVRWYFQGMFILGGARGISPIHCISRKHIKDKSTVDRRRREIAQSQDRPKQNPPKKGQGPNPQ